MYEKHIRDLIEYEHGADEIPSTTLTAAIELMRAAEPRDAEAEREHCDRVAARLATETDCKYCAQTFSAEIEAQRSTARSAAQAEIERLQTENKRLRLRFGESILGAIDSWADKFKELTTELSAAQAEIERLRADNAVLAITRETWNETQTKLDALREAAEHVCAAVPAHADGINLNIRRAVNALRQALG
jgi:hypothetical protein